MSRSLFPYIVLLIGVFFASTSSILIRLVQMEGMPSIAVSAGRLGLAVLILTPFAFARAGGEIRQLSRRDILLGLGAGAFLAAHFITWISSLEYTSVANSAALVTTNPLWVGLASWLIFRERLSWGVIVGVICTLGGSALITVSGLDEATQANFPQGTLGNLLALMGSITVSGYFLIGRGLRRRLSTLAYIWLVYTSGAVVLVICMFAMGQTVLGFSAFAYLCLLGLAIGPQLIGHTTFNWALGHISATLVALAILGEPIGSAILAWFIFDERIDPTTITGLLQILGFVLILAGIYVAARYDHTSEPPPEPEL